MNFKKFQEISRNRGSVFTGYVGRVKSESLLSDFRAEERDVAQRAFTIIEMIVAVALFTTVALVAVGSILAMVDANRKAQSLKSVMDNLHFALQGMSLSLQVGEEYSCDSLGDCSGGTELELTSAEKDQIIYSYNAGTKRIERSVNGGNSIPITAPEVAIDDLSFYVVGSSPADDRQPLVIITIEGTAGVSERTQTTFFVQTAASPRKLDD